MKAWNIHHRMLPGNPWGPFDTLEDARSFKRRLIEDWLYIRQTRAESAQTDLTESSPHPETGTGNT